MSRILLTRIWCTLIIISLCTYIVTCIHDYFSKTPEGRKEGALFLVFLVTTEEKRKRSKETKEGQGQGQGGSISTESNRTAPKALISNDGWMDR